MTATLNNITAVLKGGGVCVLPTETVYGIACRADHPKAIDRIYAIKGRGFDKPLAVCVRDIEAAKKLAEFDDMALKLAKEFWPGPLTLVLPVKNKTLDKRCYQGGTIALRCPDIEWREHFKQPLALTSANKSGEPAATTAETGLEVDAVLNTGPSREKIPSTILAVKDGKVTCLREGALKADALAAYTIEWPND
ncbi:L-threonylcarbamoyladenylate synthase [Hellea sp.]|nr:L-threonylcarbamoyladenylate synthase [Hellea sp.]